MHKALLVLLLWGSAEGALVTPPTDAPRAPAGRRQPKRGRPAAVAAPQPVRKPRAKVATLEKPVAARKAKAAAPRMAKSAASRAPTLQEIVGDTLPKAAATKATPRRQAKPTVTKTVPKLHEIVSGADSHLRRNARTPRADEAAARSVVLQRQREVALPVASAPATTVTAWIILGKRSVRDQLTLEQAARVHAAVRLLKSGKERPSVLVFCGGDLADVTARAASSTANPTAELHVSPASLAYGFFRSAAEAQGLNLDGISFVVEQRCPGAHNGIISAALAVRLCRREQHGSRSGGGRSGGGPANTEANTPTLVRLFSTDHHLQRLHDVELLTPRQSALQPLRELRSRVEYTHVSYPYASASDDETARRARACTYADDLQVLQLNLEGMLHAAEFLQRDNWQRLVQVRRRLSTDLLGSTAASPAPQAAGGGASARSPWLPATPCDKQCDDDAERAVGQLGKAVDLLRPVAADPIQTSLQPSELRVALQAVNDAVRLLRKGDPDRPIKPAEWQRLVERTAWDEDAVEV